MYNQCPTNPSKQTIRKLIADVTIKMGADNVFTLLGTDGGYATRLPKHINVVSAEKNLEAYNIQLDKFKDYPNFNMFNDSAAAIIRKSPISFNVIWLDFYGHIACPNNLAAVAQSYNKLTSNGLLFITTGSRSILSGNDININPQTVTENCGFNVEHCVSYSNGNGSKQVPMKLLICIKN